MEGFMSARTENSMPSACRKRSDPRPPFNPSPPPKLFRFGDQLGPHRSARAASRAASIDSNHSRSPPANHIGQLGIEHVHSSGRPAPPAYKLNGVVGPAVVQQDSADNGLVFRTGANPL